MARPHGQPEPAQNQGHGLNPRPQDPSLQNGGQQLTPAQAHALALAQQQAYAQQVQAAQYAQAQAQYAQAQQAYANEAARQALARQQATQRTAPPTGYAQPTYAPVQSQPTQAPQPQTYAQQPPANPAYQQHANYAPQVTAQGAPVQAPQPQSYRPVTNGAAAATRPEVAPQSGATAYVDAATAYAAEQARMPQSRDVNLNQYQTAAPTQRAGQPTASQPQIRPYAAPQSHPSQAYPQQAHAPQGYPQQAQPSNAYAQTAGAYAQPAGAYAQPHDPRLAVQQPGHQPVKQEHLPDDMDLGDEDDVQTPRRGKKSLAVVALLVGAVGLGAGLAYVWRINGGFKSATGGPPVIRADAAAVKTKPTEPGRRELPNQNLTVTERPAATALPPVQPASTPADAPTSVADGGPRPVRIIQINPVPVGGPPQGAVQPSANQPLIPPQSPLAGLVVQNSGPPRVAVAPPQAAVSPPAVPPPPAVIAPSTPKRVALAPTVQPAEPAPPAAAPAQKAKAPVQKAAPASDAFSPGTPVASAAPAAAPAGVGAPPATKAPSLGFVAAVSSRPTREDAMRAYADMQQKYGPVIGNLPADIRPATVNGSTVYRAVIGIPGSRESASGICAKLKEAGYTSCWPTAY